MLFWKTKEKGKEILHLGPWTSISFSTWVPGRTRNRGGIPAGASERRSGARLGSARSSPWRVDGRPRRACKKMAPRGEAERLRETKDGARRGHGAWPAASRTAGAEREGKERVERKRENDVWGPHVRFEFS